MNKTNKILLVAVIVLLVALVGLFVWREWGSTPSYYAVALRTGDVYFGRLTRFPTFGLRQVYLLQVNQGNAQNPVSVQRFKNAFWGPQDFLEINRNEVVWMAALDPAGQLARVIASNPDLIPSPQAPSPSPAPAPQGSPSKQ